MVVPVAALSPAAPSPVGDCQPRVTQAASTDPLAPSAVLPGPPDETQHTITLRLGEGRSVITIVTHGGGDISVTPTFAPTAALHPMAGGSTGPPSPPDQTDEELRRLRDEIGAMRGELTQLRMELAAGGPRAEAMAAPQPRVSHGPTLSLAAESDVTQLDESAHLVGTSHTSTTRRLARAAYHPWMTPQIQATRAQTAVFRKSGQKLRASQDHGECMWRWSVDPQSSNCPAPLPSDTDEDDPPPPSTSCSRCTLCGRLPPSPPRRSVPLAVLGPPDVPSTSSARRTRSAR